MKVGLSPDRVLYRRQFYTLLDLIGDVAGLLCGLYILGSGFMFLYTLVRGHPVMSYLLSSVYLVDKSIVPQYESDRASIHRMKVRHNFQLPFSYCHCLRKQREKRMIERGLKRSLQELEIDRFIRAQKKMRIVLKTLFTRIERFLLSNNQSFVIYSSTDDNYNSSSSRESDFITDRNLE